MSTSRIVRKRLLPGVLLAGALGCVYDPIDLPPPELGALPDAAGPAGAARAEAGPEASLTGRDDAGAPVDTAAGSATMPDGAAPPGSRIPDAAAEVATTVARPCTERTRELRAVDGVSLDYGPPPRDPPSFDPLEVAVGRLHDHDHDVVAWLKFPFDGVPPGAQLRGARVWFTAQINAPTPVPDIALVHSPADGWSKSSTDPSEVPRATSVGGGSGPLLRGRQSAQLDVAAYGPLWAGDLRDGFFTLGIAPADDARGIFRYATVQSAVPGNGADPALELTTCE